MADIHEPIFSRATTGVSTVEDTDELLVSRGGALRKISGADLKTAAAAVIDLTHDILDLVGDGVPVDYTDGTPPATGETVAGKGSRYTDYTNAKLYINTGTKAQPAWTLVGTQS